MPGYPAMARMGESLEREVKQRYPDFPARDGRLSWENDLPPFGPNLRSLAERYESRRAKARSAGRKPIARFHNELLGTAVRVDSCREAGPFVAD
jgi:hypothetical protein